MYFWFPLSCRDVEDLLAERGIDVSYETVRRRANNGKRSYPWRAVDSEGEVSDILVQSRRNKTAALKLMRKLFKKQGFVPDAINSDKLPSFGTALRDLGLSRLHEFGGRKNNRAESSHLPVRQRERRVRRFKFAGTAQRLLSTHAAWTW
jgi:putative transposase